jgi:hypothetical protein
MRRAGGIFSGIYRLPGGTGGRFRRAIEPFRGIGGRFPAAGGLRSDRARRESVPVEPFHEVVVLGKIGSLTNLESLDSKETDAAQ